MVLHDIWGLGGAGARARVCSLGSAITLSSAALEPLCRLVKCTVRRVGSHPPLAASVLVEFYECLFNMTLLLAYKRLLSVVDPLQRKLGRRALQESRQVWHDTLGLTL